MGDVAKMKLNGTLCQQCGELMIDEGEKPYGYPVFCVTCGNHLVAALRAHKVRTQCPQCQRTFAGSISLKQHLRDSKRCQGT